jgi:hypothetical protein
MNADTHQVDLREDQRRDFEDQVVCKVLRGGRVIRQIRQFREEQRKLTGNPQLTLAWLQQRFPAFPLRLGVILFDADTPAWIDFYHRFTGTPCFEAYRGWCRCEGINDRKETVGLVFNMDGRTFVLHNCQANRKWLWKRVIRTLGDPPVTFVLEGFHAFLAGLGRAWNSGKTTLVEESE